MVPISSLLLVFDAFVARSGAAESTVSTRFLGAGHRIAALRDGGDMGARTIERALIAFSDAWPADAAWPDGVVRPSSRRTDSAAGDLAGPEGSASRGSAGPALSIPPSSPAAAPPATGSAGADSREVGHATAR